ncbi:hypothetical protein D3C71_2037290 [compost metagenome]
MGASFDLDLNVAERKTSKLHQRLLVHKKERKAKKGKDIFSEELSPFPLSQPPQTAAAS